MTDTEKSTRMKYYELMLQAFAYIPYVQSGSIALLFLNGSETPIYFYSIFAISLNHTIIKLGFIFIEFSFYLLCWRVVTFNLLIAFTFLFSIPYWLHRMRSVFYDLIIQRFFLSLRFGFQTQIEDGSRE